MKDKRNFAEFYTPLPNIPAGVLYRSFGDRAASFEHDLKNPAEGYRSHGLVSINNTVYVIAFQTVESSDWATNKFLFKLTDVMKAIESEKSPTLNVPF